MSDCSNVAEDAIAAISQLLTNLSELSLQAYHVTDTAMAYFTAKQVSSFLHQLHADRSLNQILCDNQEYKLTPPISNAKSHYIQVLSAYLHQAEDTLMLEP